MVGINFGDVLFAGLCDGQNYGVCFLFDMCGTLHMQLKAVSVRAGSDMLTYHLISHHLMTGHHQ